MPKFYDIILAINTTLEPEKLQCEQIWIVMDKHFNKKWKRSERKSVGGKRNDHRKMHLYTVSFL